MLRDIVKATQFWAGREALKHSLLRDGDRAFKGVSSGRQSQLWRTATVVIQHQTKLGWPTFGATESS